MSDEIKPVDYTDEEQKLIYQLAIKLKYRNPKHHTTRGEDGVKARFYMPYYTQAAAGLYEVCKKMSESTKSNPRVQDIETLEWLDILAGLSKYIRPGVTTESVVQVEKETLLIPETKKHAGILKDSPIAGIPIYIDPDAPEGEVRAVDKDGKTVGKIENLEKEGGPTLIFGNQDDCPVEVAVCPEFAEIGKTFFVLKNGRIAMSPGGLKDNTWVYMFTAKENMSAGTKVFLNKRTAMAYPAVDQNHYPIVDRTLMRVVKDAGAVPEPNIIECMVAREELRPGTPVVLNEDGSISAAPFEDIRWVEKVVVPFDRQSGEIVWMTADGLVYQYIGDAPEGITLHKFVASETIYAMAQCTLDHRRKTLAPVEESK